MIKYLFVLILLYLTQTKRIKQSYLIKSLKDWHYISKFGAETGEVFYSLTFRIKNADENDERTIPIQYELYLDEEWQNAIEKSECERNSVARRKETIWIPVKSGYEFKGSLTAKVRAHLWYFGFSDCEKQLRNSFPVENKVKLEVELHITNVGDTEFTLEQFGILQIIGVIAFIDVIMLIYNGNQILEKQKKYEEFSLPLFLLVITLLLETFSYSFLTIHLWIYSENGAGSILLQILSVIFQVASQFSLTMILVMLSWGWQINFSKFDNFELFLPISILIGFFQITIVGVSFIDYDSYYKDHSYEGWVGWLAALIYIGEFIYFMNGLVDTYNKQNTKIQQFILLLGLYGGVYFISFPVLQTVNLFTARYVRYKVMEIGTMLFRTSAILLLTRLFTSKKSIFAQISIENKSFLDRNKDE
ncbi:unnamed protein product [Paramecium pentaurelia]|uniref:GPR180/TMEM145 transmembrane domain-containing protein n=1 Tax=Paramecium pentaurelia TaxID=43138 RepID=A0A8S1WR59_9CILI|nr:unnamed protein product [Paramecium pentaurelia]